MDSEESEEKAPEELDDYLTAASAEFNRVSGFTAEEVKVLTTLIHHPLYMRYIGFLVDHMGGMSRDLLRYNVIANPVDAQELTITQGAVKGILTTIELLYEIISGENEEQDDEAA